MIRKSYDARNAEALIPLLRSITNEIQEREEAIDRRTARLHVAGAALTARERSQLEAELSVQKRELRMALRELERLGCMLDLDHPLRVLIPGGATGTISRFAWRPEDATIQTG
jgi:predicted nucleic acid-binding protein